MRWLRPEAWHLTLVFLGSVDPQALAALEEVVTTTARTMAPFAIRTGTGGGRISRGEGVAWLAVDAGAGTVVGLAEELAERCRERLSDAVPPKRTPAAHLTLVRRADPGVIAALREQSLGALRVAWRADRIALVRSHLGRGGSVYETLLEARFTQASRGA